MLPTSFLYGLRSRLLTALQTNLPPRPKRSYPYRPTHRALTSIFRPSLFSSAPRYHLDLIPAPSSASGWRECGAMQLKWNAKNIWHRTAFMWPFSAFWIWPRRFVVMFADLQSLNSYPIGTTTTYTPPPHLRYPLHSLLHSGTHSSSGSPTCTEELGLPPLLSSAALDSPRCPLGATIKLRELRRYYKSGGLVGRRADLILEVVGSIPGWRLSTVNAQYSVSVVCPGRSWVSLGVVPAASPGNLWIFN